MHLTTRVRIPERTEPLEFDATTNIVESIRRQVARTPRATAIVAGGTSVNYEELDERSGEVARCLLALGVKRDVVVGIHAERSIGLVVAALGVMRSGGAYMPLDPSYPMDRLAFQIEEANAGVVITVANSSRKEAAGLGKKVVHCSEFGRLNGPTVESTSEFVSAHVEPEDLSYVIYTSGSTGRPKGVEIGHANLMNMIGWYLKTLQVTKTDRVSHVAAVGFDATVWELWPALAAGACICIADDPTIKEPRKLQDWLVQQAITISFIPTPMAEKLMALNWPLETSLRAMMTGGDTLHSYPPPNLPFKVVNNYGPTECTICVTSTILPAATHFDRLPPIGRPISNTQIYIVDQALNKVPHGAEGEILIGGKGVGRGYRNRPDLTEEKFIPNKFEPSQGPRLYRTGDRGCYLPDGQIAFKGRIDDQMKIRGVRMEPAEIEAALNEHAGVRESAVVAREFGPGDKRLVAYIAAKSHPLPTPQDLREFLAHRLPAQMIPSIFVPLDQLPLNSSGKIDRPALPHPTKSNTLPRGAIDAPRDELERKLKTIWEQVLQADGIGVREDFFDLGGNSLLAVAVMAKVSEVLGFNAPLSALLEVRTIEDMAERIRRREHAENWSSLVAVQPRGSRPPLFCVHSHTGDVLYCEFISRGVGPDLPIYGIQSQGAVGKSPHTTIEAMAPHYINEIRKVQPHGPYHLFGFCFGGMVAFEMAKQLRALGEEVEFLGLYNSPAPGTLKGWPLGQFTYLRRRTQDEWRRLMAAEPSQRMTHVCRNIRNFGLLVQRTAAIEGTRVLSRIGRNGHSTGLLNLEAINIAAAKSFLPDHVFPGRLTLFLSTEVAKVYPIPPAEGWKRFAAKGLDVIEVPLDDQGWRGTPFVETVGGKIGALLRAASEPA